MADADGGASRPLPEGLMSKVESIASTAVRAAAKMDVRPLPFLK